MADTLFGPTPDMTQFAVDRERQQGLMEQAKMRPAELSRYNLLAGASGLGNQLGDAMGIAQEDPRITEAKRMEAIKQKVIDAGGDPRNMDDFYPRLIEEMQANGMIDQAANLMKNYQAAVSARETATKARASAKETTLEQKMPGLALYRRLVEQFTKEGGDLMALEEFKKTVTPETPHGNAEVLKGAIQKSKPDPKVGQMEDGTVVFQDATKGTYTWDYQRDKEGTLLPIKNFGQHKVIDASPKTQIKMPEPDKFVMGKDAELYGKYLDENQAGVKMLGRLGNLKSQLEGGTITGAGSSTQEAVLNALSTLQLNTEKAERLLGNTQAFNIEVKKLVGEAVRVYGANPSNGERLYAALSQPSLDSTQVLKHVNAIMEDVRQHVEVTQDAIDHFGQTKSWAGYRRKPVSGLRAVGGRVNAPTTPAERDARIAELERQIAAKRAQEGAR